MARPAGMAKALGILSTKIDDEQLIMKGGPKGPPFS